MQLHAIDTRLGERDASQRNAITDARPGGSSALAIDHGGMDAHSPGLYSH
ncbi:hypothetical protein ISN76_08580 [Dyella halodurans]|uniref:Uncharacterized protein n=1 Tax=Dyella halodurans TaxID=1920171 RepID=A0ABV9BY87_9GAMM|nr:hypothetical protein [Dyella halodurans]